MPHSAQHLNSVEQALSIRFNNEVYEMRERGADVIVLSLGEAFFDLPLFDFSTLPLPDSFHYGHSRGNTRLRCSLAAYYRREYGVPVDPEREILITAGSKAAIHMAFMATLDPGDEVLVLEPAWVSYSEQVKLCHAVPVMLPVGTRIEDVESFVTKRTKAVVVNNPNNPTGRIYTADEIERLRSCARRNDLFLISDEAYSDFTDGSGFSSCARGDAEKTNTIVCNSMSKNYGMSGWRVGYLISNEEVVSRVLTINQHLITCPPTILENYLVRHFSDVLEVTKPQIRSVVQKRKEIAAYMDELGVDYLPGEATFYIFASIQPSTLSSTEFGWRLLRDFQTCVVPGIGYGPSCDEFVRVSVGTESMERVREGVRRIRDLIRQTAATKHSRSSRSVAR